MKQRITILGSTGSIGNSTLQVVSLHPERFEVFALSASQNISALLQQCVQYRPRFAVLPDPKRAQDLSHRLQAEGCTTQVLSGPNALSEIAAHQESDIVMAAIVGAAGLLPSLAAARAGKRLLLANKETLVVGAGLFMQAVKAGGGVLLPIDSEHSAIFQALPEGRSAWQKNVEKIILTASGGPFRTWQPEQLKTITPEQAIAHPNWSMGRKISVDSATMMNKALEVIEASYLFDFAPSQIEVCLHPQSIVHSMVQYWDGSVLAQLGTADMRTPIAYGLSWPDRIAAGAPKLDFTQASTLHFEPVNHKLFPSLQLAWDALAGPLGSTCVLNAANEIAVNAFLEGQLRFDQIHYINQACLNAMHFVTPQNLDDLLHLDTQTRVYATSQTQRLASYT